MTVKSITFCLLVMMIIAGCSSKPEHNPVPHQLNSEVRLFDNERIRYWGDSADGVWEVVTEARQRRSAPGKEFNFLAMSGGGGNGAFSSGILNAWTDSGNRPEFDSVTGISTGAIVAVFAYLGSDYDHVLKDLYTQTEEDDLINKNNLFAIFRLSALYDTTPFHEKLRETITPELISMVAEEHRKGRLLLIGTTHMDSQRLSVWNMGEIAQVGTPEAEKLFEDVVLASAAIPGAFPPILIDVEVDGEKYQELHVDGGLSRQVFFFSDEIEFDGSWTPGNEKSTIYVITNGEFLPQWSDTEISLTYLLRRSIATLLKYQGRSDVLRIYQKSQTAGMDFNFAFVDESVTQELPKDKVFDPKLMQSLYQYGYTLKLSDMLWHKRPPGFDTVTPYQDLRFTQEYLE
ncbi:patatin-like phospholipase family protein [Vibrio sp. HN007]|uniref:patatin-like phospholipase family protein n=1 Tax=Vibrio iocasae TaxID=3098914 RepID=UPI0035D44D14